MTMKTEAFFDLTQIHYGLKRKAERAREKGKIGENEVFKINYELLYRFFDYDYGNAYYLDMSGDEGEDNGHDPSGFLAAGHEYDLQVQKYTNDNDHLVNQTIDLINTSADKVQVVSNYGCLGYAFKELKRKGVYVKTFFFSDIANQLFYNSNFTEISPDSVAKVVELNRDRVGG